MEVLKQKLAQNKYLLILSGIYLFFLILFWGKFGDPIVDCGREAYIPYAMADLGKILFKDIICIYGPLPYYLNALVIRLFGPSLWVMYSIGAVFSYAFLLLFYSLSKRFFGALSAFLISLVVLFACVFSVYIFNYIFPYSYAILYGLVFALFFIFFVFKFIDTKKTCFLYFSLLFASLSVVSKYDFLPCLLIVPVVFLFYKKFISKKTILRCIFFFALPFLIIATILVLQGVTCSDLAFNFKMMSNMAHSLALEIFYKEHTGFFFVPEKIPSLIAPFAKSVLLLAGIFSIGFFSCKIKKRFIKYGIFAVLVCLAAQGFFPVFFYFPIVVLLLFLTEIVRLSVKKQLFNLSNEENIKLLFILFTLLISIKTLFELNLNVYGPFYLPCVLISFYLVFLKFFKSRSAQYFCGVNLLNIVFFVAFFAYSLNIYTHLKSSPVETPAGTVITGKVLAKPLAQTLNFLQENLTPEDDFLVLPEGLFFNFVLGHEYKFFNTSFIPLDFEAYGEEYLKTNLLKNPPKYLIITNRDTEEYGHTYICRDYGQNLCLALNNIYKLKFSFSDENAQNPFIMHIFERKTDAKQ